MSALIHATLTPGEAKSLARLRLLAAENAADPAVQREHLEAAVRWGDRADAAKAAAAPAPLPNRFHAYTHDADGNLIRLG
jgi:hypothetical protein